MKFLWRKMVVRNVSARTGRAVTDKGMEVNRFVKKPVVIEAMQFNDRKQVEDFEKWMGEMLTTEYENSVVVISTLEGDMRANVGDWIIKGIRGEFYPCKPDIFEQTYDPVPEIKPGPVDQSLLDQLPPDDE
jgi:hypothetical protein